MTSKLSGNLAWKQKHKVGQVVRIKQKIVPMIHMIEWGYLSKFEEILYSQTRIIGI